MYNFWWSNFFIFRSFFDKINYHLKNCKNLKKITKAKNIKFAGLKGAAHLLIKNYE